MAEEEADRSDQVQEDPGGFEVIQAAGGCLENGIREFGPREIIPFTTGPDCLVAAAAGLSNVSRETPDALPHDPMLDAGVEGTRGTRGRAIVRKAQEQKGPSLLFGGLGP